MGSLGNKINDTPTHISIKCLNILIIYSTKSVYMSIMAVRGANCAEPIIMSINKIQFSDLDRLSNKLSDHIILNLTFVEKDSEAKHFQFLRESKNHIVTLILLNASLVFVNSGALKKELGF
ncbi:hypothetical protein ACJX0J_011630 [Zea mays]